MPQPRRHKTNADRQAAYRARKAAAQAGRAAAQASALPTERQPTAGEQALVARLTAQDDRARAGETY